MWSLELIACGIIIKIAFALRIPVSINILLNVQQECEQLAIELKAIQDELDSMD